MKKIALIIAFLTICFFPPKLLGQTATLTPPSAATSVTIIGDSLTTDAGAGTKLKQAFTDIQIDSEIGRPWSTGLTILNNLKNTGLIKNIVVFALGTNQGDSQVNGVSQANIDSLLAAVPDKKIVLMTIYRGDVSWDDQANNLIRSAASSNPDIKIADWSTLASQHPEWFGSDGTHPSPTGYNELARIIQEAINSSGSGPNPTDSPNPGKSNCVITKVGNPIGVAPLCPDGDSESQPVEGPCGPVLTWAQTISNSLERGQATWYNRMMTSISNGTPADCPSYTAYKRTGQGLSDPFALYWYWCTFIVLDSYNLAGLTGMDLTQADVRDMHIFMANTPGYHFVDYRTDKKGALSKIRPGYAFFVEKVFLQHQGNHTGLIHTINIDSHGNGTITTLESNNYNKSNTWNVAEWEVLNPDYGNRPLVGFGGPI